MMTSLSETAPLEIETPTPESIDLQPDSQDALWANERPANEPHSHSQSGSTCNVGRTEQKIRLGAGAALLVAASAAPLNRGWRIGMGVLGVTQLIIGTTRYCPISHALGVNTCDADEA